jgi:hypothetical protein
MKISFNNIRNKIESIYEFLPFALVLTFLLMSMIKTIILLNHLSL